MNNRFNIELTDAAVLSEIWQKIKDKDSNFAVISSRDEEGSRALMELVRDLCDEDSNVSFRRFRGSYSYADGTQVSEESVMISNISFKDAARIALTIKQRTIIWKDSNFFGIMDCSKDAPDSPFAEAFEKQLSKSGGLTFTLEARMPESPNRSLIRRLRGDNKAVYSPLLTVSVNEQCK